MSFTPGTGYSQYMKNSKKRASQNLLFDRHAYNIFEVDFAVNKISSEMLAREVKTGHPSMKRLRSMIHVI